MILQNKTDEAISVGDVEKKVAKINPEKLGKLQYMLTHGLYSDGIGSTIVEITNNALDSIIQSGKDPMKNPVYVHIEYVQGKYWLRIVDNGLGLNEEEFENVVMNYLTSTKEDSNDVIGAFGIGAKSWCSVANSANFICVKDGIEYNFLVHKGTMFLEYETISKKETDKENGVTFMLQIEDYWHKNQFVEKAKQKLCYYDNVVLIVDGRVVENKIYRSEHFQWSTMNSNQYLHFSLKDVYYTIDFAALGFDKHINIPLCLRFGLEDGIRPDPSREKIIYTEAVKKLFRAKIEKVAQYFLNKYNETIKEFDTLVEAFDYVDPKYYKVKLEDKEFLINSLLNAAKLKPNEVKIKGLTFQNANFYHGKMDDFFYEYKIVAYIGDTGAYKRKFPSIKHHLLAGDDVVLLKDSPQGRFKTFLGETYGPETLFIAPDKPRKLGTSKTWSGYNTYRHILNLTTHPKSEWRALIKEFQFVRDGIMSHVEDAKDLENSQEFQDWLDEKKEEAKQNRQRNGSNYKKLNKQEGDITIGWARKHKHTEDVVFDKSVLNLQNLHRNPYITVYFNREELEYYEGKIKALFHLYNDGTKYGEKIRLAWLNRREIKNIKHLHNFKTYNEFMETKVISRFVTAMAIDRAFDLIPENDELIYKAFPRYQELYDKLEAYKDVNHKSCDYTLRNELFKLAEEQKLWDMEIYADVQQFQKLMDQFSFLKFIDVPRNPTEDQEKVLNNILYVLYKHRKVTGTDFDNLELVEKQPEVVAEATVELDENLDAVEEVEEDEGFDFYQPETDNTGFIFGHDEVLLDSWKVWKSKKALLAAYPECTPVGMMEGDVRNPKFMDDVVEIEIEIED